MGIRGREGHIIATCNYKPWISVRACLCVRACMWVYVRLCVHVRADIAYHLGQIVGDQIGVCVPISILLQDL